MDTKNFLENNMKSRRIEMGLSQRECAKKLGVSLVAYQNWEHGICSVSRTPSIYPAPFPKLNIPVTP